MIIYLDSMLLMGYSIEEISMCCDTEIFFLQHLGFVINWKKSVLTPMQVIEFFWAKNQLTHPRNISHREENTESKNNLKTDWQNQRHQF